MAELKRYAFWIDVEQLRGLDAIRERDGILPSEQIRRAIDAWLKEKGITKMERQRPVGRKRS